MPRKPPASTLLAPGLMAKSIGNLFNGFRTHRAKWLGQCERRCDRSVPAASDRSGARANSCTNNPHQLLGRQRRIQAAQQGLQVAVFAVELLAALVVVGIELGDDRPEARTVVAFDEMRHLVHQHVLGK